MFDFSPTKSRIADTHAWLRTEYKGLRTGRATPTLLDGIQVESYGARVPLNQVANVGVEDARTLRVTPWDASQVKEIEKAVTQADLGVGVSADEKSVRVSFPELTVERRESLIKLAKDKLEHARTSVRGIRDDAWSEIQQQERDGDISEDEKFRYKDELQKLIDAANDELETFFTKKEEEIRS